MTGLALCRKHAADFLASLPVTAAAAVVEVPVAQVGVAAVATAAAKVITR
jgi:hypothetical protein